MKLKCANGRRVMVLASGTVIHREDGSVCDQKLQAMKQFRSRIFPQPMTDQGWVTKRGTTLTGSDIEALVDEAERGYDIDDVELGPEDIWEPLR